MTGAAHTVWQSLGGPLAALTPEDRINALRHVPPLPVFWLWILLGCLAALVLMGMLAMLISRSAQRKRNVQAIFHAQAEHLGLSGEERSLLVRIAELAGVADLAAIFTMDDAFAIGSMRFLHSQQVTALDEQGRGYATSLVNSLREKLGFQVGPGGEAMILSNTRQLTEGTRVEVMHRGKPDAFGATVSRADAAELVVQTEFPVTAKAGESWLIRLAEGGCVWEFDAPVVGAADGCIVLGHSENIRFINRRRFPRVAVSRPALLAPFSFLKPDANEAPPAFAKASLVEIAGPGLRLQCDLEFHPGEKAIVVLKLHDKKVVQALAKVRRTLDAAGRREVIVELIGLNAAEVAELARETSQASRKQEEPAQAAPPQSEQAPVAVSA